MAYDIFDEMRMFFEDIDRVFGGNVKALPGSRDLSVRTPLTDIEENEKEVIANVEIPRG